MAFGKRAAFFFQFAFGLLGTVLPPMHATADEAGAWGLSIALPALSGMLCDVYGIIAVRGGGFSGREQGVVDGPLDCKKLSGQVICSGSEEVLVDTAQGGQDGRCGLMLPSWRSVIEVDVIGLCSRWGYVCIANAFSFPIAVGGGCGCVSCCRCWGVVVGGSKNRLDGRGDIT